MPDRQLHVYNTLTRTKERFAPQVEGEVRMYVCGPTVYDLSHVGHARKEVVFDVIVRYLRRRRARVTYVRNVTDVDDKIIQRAQEEGRAWREVALEYEEAFRRDTEALGVLAPDHEPRATETLDEMRSLIGTLVDKGLAYTAEDGVYFSVSDWTGYGKLSRRRIEELVAGARVEVDVAKKNPLDFALWKASKPGEPSWPSPWGEGRPGWHIECSAMSRQYLGETLDIHGGGVDLVFPHHENEIAQSEAASGKPYCLYWVHNGLLTVRKEKMAKSLGNYVTIQEALARWHPETIRFFFLSHHYRTPVDFTDENLAEARKNLDYFYNTLLRIEEVCGKEAASTPSAAPPETVAGMAPEDARRVLGLAEGFEAHMDDDFNSAEAVGEMFRAATALNRWIDHGGRASSAEGKGVLRAFAGALRAIGDVLGVFREDPLGWFRQGGDRSAPGPSDDDIEARVRERDEARRRKEWAVADRIRDELASLGVALEDGPQGTRWKRQS